MVTRRRRRIGVHEQLAWVRRCWPRLRSAVHGARLVVAGEFQPSPLGDVYHVRLQFEVGEPPEVRVVSPELRRRSPDERIPHMYGQELLCLYLPGAGEWSADKILAHHVIPWIPLWLHYYELWHATGEWLGGGVEPTTRTPIRNPEDREEYERGSPRG